MNDDVTDGRFPDGFLWGTATAAHQIEGGNWNNDWWAWEHTEGSPTAEPSGDACDSWNRWEEDVALVADLGVGTYRFSVEWSRIEPEEGEWSRAAVAHYRRLCEALRAHGVEPTVTLHHFTTPRWVVARGGW
ncbi:MAG TPA: family 1 glycosylhydrolase, partial [Acidimicrobiales bacterium]|nr:family 1 glycosylhydrolase [Acidimicrobiales bacterium]